MKRLVDKETSMLPVILSRSEGSPGRDETVAIEDTNTQLPPNMHLLFTPGDPSLRFRMTGEVIDSTSTIRAGCAEE